ncbi:hypothetical protein FGB62_112g12 [Gracilaria domingensis]|nr:hypothetical protein FGB62_112g12 [Gracilaria domingensis]
MCPTPHASVDEQPLLIVRDYCPSLHHSSSSEPPESTDDDKYQFQPVRPCPFADVPKRSKLGHAHKIRHAGGLHKERPLITKVESPLKLRSWSINGPDESVDPCARFPIVYEDDHITVRMKDTELLRTQWELLNMRPGYKARIGKISPLQKSNIKPMEAPRVVQPDPRRGKRFSISKSQVIRVDEMLHAAARFVEEPSDLSDSSHDSEEKLDFTFQSSSDSSDSSRVNFCLRSSSEHSSGSEECREDEGDDRSEQVLTLTRRVAQLTALTISLEQELSKSESEKKQLQQQLQALHTAGAVCCEAPTSPRGPGTNAEASTETVSKRRSSKKKFMVREEERLRLELMEERQRTAHMQEENGRLLAVILRLKGEMELEHDLKMRMEKKAVSEMNGGRSQRCWKSAASSNGSSGSRRKVAQWRRWMFGKSKSSIRKMDPV